MGLPHIQAARDAYLWKLNAARPTLARDCLRKLRKFPR